MPSLQRSIVWAVAACLLSGCAAVQQPLTTGPQGGLAVVATTPVIADMASRVLGDRGRVESLVPPGADPHTYEPSLRGLRSVVYADVAFSNYLMLEPHAMIKTLDANLRPGTPNVALAEASTKYGAEVIPLVENATLDSLWLGLRVQGSGEAHGANRSSEIEFQVTGVDGPGTMAAYVTETFGRPRIFSSSHDGFSDGHDAITLPAQAHTHMSWAFAAPGVYRMHARTRLLATQGVDSGLKAQGDVVFCVGTDPRDVPELKDRRVLDAGHADLTTDLDTGKLTLSVDVEGGKRRETVDLDQAVVWVPPKVLTEIPGSPDFRFLGKPGSQIYQLPQAVLGAHVHGEIDPHLWLNINNAKAYVRTIQDVLTKADPAGAATYAHNAGAYLAELTATDSYVAEKIKTIPVQRRHVITTHDAYGYFSKAYGLSVAGFVTPNPSVEPSMAQRKKLSATIRELKVPAVFLEPTMLQQSSVLKSLAKDSGVAVCPIYSDTLDSHVRSYVEMMRFNADSLTSCLSK